MAYKVVGGTKWWQVRAGIGVEGEWLVMKKDWRESNRADKERAKDGAVGSDGGLHEDGRCEFLKHQRESISLIHSPERDG